MSSYRGGPGAWDGGPPGAEADYATQRAPPFAAPMPTTDPWTGVSYSHYGPPQYDYQAYGAHSYGYNYDSSYYQKPDGSYYDMRSTYPPQHSSYDYPRQRERTRSPYDPRNYVRRRQSYRSKSRTASPYGRRSREYSRKRENNYENSRRHTSRSRGSKTKRTKYSSSDRSSSRSRSRSYSVSSKDNKKRSVSTVSSSSTSSSYKDRSVTRHKSCLSPPLSKKTSKPSRRSVSIQSIHSSRSSTPKPKMDKAEAKSKMNYHSSKETKSKDKRQRCGSITPRKRCLTPESPKGQRKSSRTLTTPTKKNKQSTTPLRKHQPSEPSSMKPRDSSVTPPRCYAREQSTQSSGSRSRSATPKKTKRSRSRRPRSRSSSRSSTSSKYSRNRSKRRPKQKVEKEGRGGRERSRTRSKSRHRRSVNRSRSRSHRRSRSPKPSNQRSRSRGSRSGSRSGTPSDDERRGQFTVADRKRFWKLHKSMQEKKESAKSPPIEIRPPPGAIESTKVDDIEYGDPPEVEGVNFAELLPPLDEHAAQVSTLKSKQIPIPIKNDGSFLEMFKKMQGETQKSDEVEKKPEIKKPALPFIGKRRGGRVLKTGLVKKPKAIDEQTVDNTPKDAWSLYMQEVKKYRETSCEEERKTRPLVK